MSKENSVFTVNSKALKKVQPNSFKMSITLSSKDSDKEEARKKLEKRVREDFNPVFESLSKFFEESSIRKSYQVYQSQNYRKDKCFDGYFYCAFQCNDASKAKEIYEQFNSIKNIQVSAPAFCIKNVGYLEKELLKTAKEKADEQAKMECEAMGVSFGDFKICAWQNSFYYRDVEVGSASAKSAVRSMASLESNSGDEDDALSFDPEDIDVSLDLEVSYEKA